MILLIDTTLGEEIAVSLIDGEKEIRRQIKAPRQQAEKLLPLIMKLLKQQAVAWEQIKEVRVQNEGDSFTSLRIGVLTANALAYALGVPATSVSGLDTFKFSKSQAVQAHYQSEPNIGKKKILNC